MSLRLPWPRSLGGRTMIVLIAAVILVHLGSMLFYRESAMDAASHAHAVEVASRVAAAKRAVEERPRGERDATAHALSSASLMLRWDTDAMVDDTHDARLDVWRREMLDRVPGLRLEDIRLQYGDRQPPGDPHALLGAARLPDGSFLNFSVPLLVGIGAAFHGALLSTTLMAVGVALVAALLMRTLSSPLRGLAEAADAIGRGPQVGVPESGPEEVRHVAQAFNAMQTRIQRLISDRTQALAAVSHDLRTPITRLRLRAGFLADHETQAAIDADLDEMEAMIDATLAYLRGKIEHETPKRTDLAAILATLVDAAADAGRPASFDGPQHVFLALHGLAMKRAFANLLDNALTYGGIAHVILRTTETTVRVTVDDDGPGIPEGELERVFEPFQRLDSSRNRRTGGVGLGLAIVRQSTERQGGIVKLSNRATGGLRAEVVLPQQTGSPAVNGPLSVNSTTNAIACGGIL